MDEKQNRMIYSVLLVIKIPGFSSKSFCFQGTIYLNVIHMKYFKNFIRSVTAEMHFGKIFISPVKHTDRFFIILKCQFYLVLLLSSILLPANTGIAHPTSDSSI